MGKEYLNNSLPLKKRAKGKRKLSKFGLFIIITFIVLVIAAIITVVVLNHMTGYTKSTVDIWKYVKPIKGTPGEIAEEFPNVKRVNVLLLGVSPPIETTDTMMLASFDMDNKLVDIISVPRDTYYPRGDYYQGVACEKINSQNSVPQYNTDSTIIESQEEREKAYSDGAGPISAAVATAKLLYGMPIHYYALITDGGIKKIVDAMGGVEFDVPLDMHYTDAGHGLYIDLKQGKQVLNGDQAIQLLRFRKGFTNGYNGGDEGRRATQQKFMKQVFKQALGIGLIKTISTALKVVQRNVSNKLAIMIAAKGLGIKRSNFKTVDIPGDTGMLNGGSFFFPDKDNLKEFIRKIYVKSEKATLKRLTDDTK